MEEKEIKGYKTIQGNNCIISCVRNILEFYTGDSIRECDIYLIGNGLGVEYHRTNTEVLISSKVFRVAMNFLDITNIQFQKKTYIDPNVAICEIKNNINANTPVIVQLLAKELDYANAFGGGEDVIHYFNIIGFTDDMLLVSDSYVPTAPPTSYRGLYSTRKILQSMNSAGNLIVTINMSDKEKKAFRELYTPEFVQEFVKRRICEYLNSKKENKDGYYTGFYAIEEMAKDIAEFDIIFAENFTKKMIALKIMIKQYGLLHSRQYLYDYLMSINFPCRDCVYGLKEIIAKWNSVCSKLVRESIVRKKKIFC